MDKKKLVCFDIDGTLVDGISWYILTEGLGCSIKIHEEIYHKVLNHEMTLSEAEKQLVKLYQKKGKINFKTVYQIYNSVLLRKDSYELIDYLKKKGYLIYLISGAVDLYVKIVAEKIHADGYFSNSSLEFNEKGDLKKLHYRVNQGSVKLEQLESLVAKLDIDIQKEVYFIGDSENDIEVFKATGHGIAVHCKDENLLKVARKKVDSLAEIKSIL